MNFIDFIIILVIVLFAIQGFRKGLIYEIASLTGLILGIYASFHFSGYIEGYLMEYINIPEKYSAVTAFILIFIVVILLVHLIGKIIEQVVNIIALGLLNKLTGSVFGILKAIIILSLSMLIINHFDNELFSKEKKEKSLLYKKIEIVAPLLWEGFEKYGRDKLPDDLKTNEHDVVTSHEYYKKNMFPAAKTERTTEVTC